MEVTFSFVPESQWEPDHLSPELYLPEGFVYLYRVGFYEHEHLVEFNRPIELPAGDWAWIGEAPGFVTVAAGLLSISGEETSSRRIVWPVAPACRVELQADESVLRLDRLDVVSLARGAVYPLVPGIKHHTWVPAGRFLSYSVGSRGLVGISEPATCIAGEELVISLPAAPPRGKQDLMVSVEHPEATAPEELTASLEPTREGATVTRLPTASAWTPGRGTLFFLDVDASSAYRLRLQHPELRTATRRVPHLSGEAHELESLVLRPRPDLELTVDFQTRRPHRSAALHLYRCGLRRGADPLFNLRDCVEAAPPLLLQEGQQPYRFSDLDDGQYQVDAIVDGERIPGVGNYLTPYLGSDDAEFPIFDPVPLWEMEIYGQILADGEPAAGEVRIESDEAGTVRVRRFPTDPEDVYHLYYFATVANRFDLTLAGLSLDELERPAEERMGWFGMSSLQACSNEGYCRVYHLKSALLGEGRLDFDLGSPRELEVEVTDRLTGDPVDGALVAYRPAGKALRFRDGKVSLDDPPDAHATALYTDGAGLARLRALPDGSFDLGISREGYIPAKRTLSVPPSTPMREVVVLDRDLEQGSTQLVLADGTELSGAAVLVYDDEGTWNRSCSKVADIAGRLELSASCLEDTTAVVVHPLAALTPLPMEALALLAETEIEVAPDPPLLLRLRGADGHPIAGVPIAVSFDEIVVGPDQLIFSARTLGPSVLWRTNADGEVLLQGVDPNGSVTPTVVVWGSPDSRRELAGVDAGEIVEIQVAE